MRRTVAIACAAFFTTLTLATLLAWISSYWYCDAIGYCWRPTEATGRFPIKFIATTSFRGTIDFGHYSFSKYNIMRLPFGLQTYHHNAAQIGSGPAPHWSFLGLAWWSQEATHGSLATLSVPYWLLLAALSPVAIWFTRSACRRRRFGPGLCDGCGYDLRSGHARCPECGKRTANSHQGLAATNPW